MQHCTLLESLYGNVPLVYFNFSLDTLSLAPRSTVGSQCTELRSIPQMQSFRLCVDAQVRARIRYIEVTTSHRKLRCEEASSNISTELVGIENITILCRKGKQIAKVLGWGTPMNDSSSSHHHVEITDFSESVSVYRGSDLELDSDALVQRVPSNLDVVVWKPERDFSSLHWLMHRTDEEERENQYRRLKAETRRAFYSTPVGCLVR